MEEKILQSNINSCIQTREKAAQSFVNLCKTRGLESFSEKQLAEAWAEQLNKDNKIYHSGWYVPPPLGIGILFGQPTDYSRTKYDNLRKEEFSPQNEVRFSSESAAMIYASPVNKADGIMGDFGLTVYTGSNTNVREHLKTGLAIVEKTAEFAQVGMEFREVNNYSQKLLKEHDLNNDRTAGYTAKIPKSIGHTIPFTYELPNEKERAVIRNEEFDALKELLRTKRVNLDAEEKFKIPTTVAFTTEIRAESNHNPNLPNAFFHLIVTFAGGKKEILANFNEVFQALKMDYIKSGL